MYCDEYLVFLKATKILLTSKAKSSALASRNNFIINRLKSKMQICYAPIFCNKTIDS